MPELNARDDLRAARLRIAAREGVPAIAVLSWETPGGAPPAMTSAAVEDGRVLDDVLAAAWEELAADQREDDLASVAAVVLTAAVRDASPIVDAPAPVGLAHPPDGVQR